MAVSDIFACLEWEGGCYAGGEGYLQDFRTVHNFFSFNFHGGSSDSALGQLPVAVLVFVSLLGACCWVGSSPVAALAQKSELAALLAWRAGQGTGHVPVAFKHPADFPCLLQFQPLLIWAWEFLGLCWESLWNFCFAWVGTLASVLCPSSPIRFLNNRNSYNSPASSLGFPTFCCCYGSFVILVGLEVNTWERNKRPRKPKNK